MIIKPPILSIRNTKYKIQSLAQELPCALGIAIKKKKILAIIFVDNETATAVHHGLMEEFLATTY